MNAVASDGANAFLDYGWPTTETIQLLQRKSPSERKPVAVIINH